MAAKVDKASEIVVPSTEPIQGIHNDGKLSIMHTDADFLLFWLNRDSMLRAYIRTFVASGGNTIKVDGTELSTLLLVLRCDPMQGMAAPMKRVHPVDTIHKAGKENVWLSPCPPFPHDPIYYDSKDNAFRTIKDAGTPRLDLVKLLERNCVKISELDDYGELKPLVPYLDTVRCRDDPTVAPEYKMLVTIQALRRACATLDFLANHGYLS